MVYGIKDLTNFTTDHGAYINDDLKSGYQGKFFEGKMIQGQPVKIEGMDQLHQIVIPKFSDPQGPFLKHCINSDGQFQDSLMSDLIEDKYVYVNDSKIAGQGLFAKRDIPNGAIFAFFGGKLYTAQAWNDTFTKFFDPQYVVKFKDGKYEYVIHLPDEYGNDMNKYR